MKLLIAIVQDKDAHLLGDEFAQANIRATRLSTQVDSYAQETLLSSSGLKKNVYKKR